MQTLNKKVDATREKDIYRVTVVGSVVNFLLLVFKFFAGIVGHRDVYKRQLLAPRVTPWYSFTLLPMMQVSPITTPVPWSMVK